MQLKKEERSIMAYFADSNSAQRAQKELKEAGISEMQIDRVSRYGTNTDAEINNAITGRPTQTGLTIFSDKMLKLDEKGDEVDRRVLLGSDPSVSGMAAEDYGVAGDKSFLLTVVTSDEKEDAVRKIVKQNGGLV